MGAFIAIAASQNRTRDCYASAPNLDLTLRSNGEETVQIMDSFGSFTQAGFDPPSIAPTLALGSSGGGLTNNTWVGYIYVYAAKNNYPQVDAGTSAGGSIAPRSNPSPSGNINIMGGAHHVLVTVATSQRSDISHIWIYRTGYFSTQQEAIDSANAGTAFFIAEIANNPNSSSLIYDDSTTVGEGGEECDIDNFTAPQFQFCAYFDPYFWGFGNFAIIANVEVFLDGSFVLADFGDAFFGGRNAQVISFVGITSGGYDGHGNFYFKQTAFNIGQCYIDIALTQTSEFNFSGATQATIKGPSNILYRSKPHNPLSWGETILVDEERIPTLYTFRIGGGDGTAISIIPNLNLLKLDTQAPGVSYLLNLRLAGTTSFEQSKRELSRGFSVSNNFSQFSTIDQNGNSVLWGYDFKTSSILQCDGSSQVPISTKIFDSLRALEFSNFDHGIYDDHTELAVFWFKTGALGEQNDIAFLYHVPTGNWSMHQDWDVSASATIFNSADGENKTIIGTSYGNIGQAFVEDSNVNWLVDSALPIANIFDFEGSGLGYDMQLAARTTPAFDITKPQLYVGNYMRICNDPTHSIAGGIVKIVAVISSSRIHVVFVNGSFSPPASMVGFLGFIPTSFTKFSQLSSPTIQKQLTEMFLTGKGIYDATSNGYFTFAGRLALELELFNIFSNATQQTRLHFLQNGAQGYYNKSLAPNIAFSSIIGLTVDMINGTIPIELKDYSLAFENS